MPITVISPFHHLGDGFGRNALGREGKAHDHKESVEDLNRTNDEAANASEKAQYHRNDDDQPEFPDQAFNPTFNPSRRHGPIRSSVRSLINRISGLGCDTLRDPIGVLSATSTNSQDSKNGGFYLPRSRDCRGALPSSKTIVLMALAVVHGQSRGGL